ncbi:CinA family protein [Herbiconiux sp. CPCC 203407]|uniref:CinA family protein n=1 Tax=Herbiconiux oxytropis TaxID=2970915 RepID=A0AA41XEN5_9MICO|nr:CinA family protein [Herbiconiux oxytropis]MCS5720831.1 CinA family protein [Herbiconiux oxytropis]MCS5724308.1 CinA family protein [Herbiconiux oxytropis]
MSETVASRIIASLTRSRTTIAVAESLTGGLLTSALVDVPGASAVLHGGVVAYDTALKHSVLGVDAEVLAAHGAVHPDVAMQMAVGVRTALEVRGEPAAIGLSTTGVAGPEPQDGHDAGVVFIGLAIGHDVRSFPLRLEGDRRSIREQTVERALEILEDFL